MPSLKDLKNRSGSVTNTRKITSAMKMVAAAKLRRAQDAAEAGRPYAERKNAVIAGLAASVNGAISTILAAVLAIPIGLAFDGTPRAVLIGTFIGLAISYALMLKLGPRPASEV